MTIQVKAVLAAALYPNVAVMDSGAGPNARPTWHDGQGGVVIHPSSVNHPLVAVQYLRPYLVYLEKVILQQHQQATTHAMKSLLAHLCLYTSTRP